MSGCSADARGGPGVRPRTAGVRRPVRRLRCAPPPLPTVSPTRVPTVHSLPPSRAVLKGRLDRKINHWRQRVPPAAAIDSTSQEVRDLTLWPLAVAEFRRSRPLFDIWAALAFWDHVDHQASPRAPPAPRAAHSPEPLLHVCLRHATPAPRLPRPAPRVGPPRAPETRGGARQFGFIGHWFDWYFDFAAHGARAEGAAGAAPRVPESPQRTAAPPAEGAQGGAQGGTGGDGAASRSLMDDWVPPPPPLVLSGHVASLTPY